MVTGEQSKNQLLLYISSGVVVISLLVHLLHKQFNFLEHQVILLNGTAEHSGIVEWATNILFIVPIILTILSWLLYKKNSTNTGLPMLITLSLTFSSISIIAGGDGLVEYHFSIFMVLAFIASYQSIQLILVSTVIFAVQHLLGYFALPQIICGTENYAFSLLMLHAVFLILTSLATILIIHRSKTVEMALKEKEAKAREELQLLLNELDTVSSQVVQYSKNISDGANLTIEATQEIAQAIQVNQKDLKDQAQSLQQCVMRNEELFGEIEEIQASSESVASKAKENLSIATTGKNTVHQVSDQMDVITTSIEGIHQLVTHLANQSQQITHSLNEIEAISEQTKLLALNASIEAARAGEHGKGFAVVADEIRKLATHSQTSTSEIQSILTQIDEQVHSIATKMDSGMTEINRGSETIQESAKLFNTILVSMQQVEEEIDHISAATNIVVKNAEQTNNLFNNILVSNNHAVEELDVISEASGEQYRTSKSFQEVTQSLQTMAATLDELMLKIKK